MKPLPRQGVVLSDAKLEKCYNTDVSETIARMSRLSILLASAAAAAFARADGSISTAAQLSAALLGKAEPEAKFTLEAQISCIIPFDERLRYLTLKDETGSAFVTEVSDSKLSSLKRGDIIRASGIMTETGLVSGYPQAQLRRVAVIGHREPQPPTPIGGNEIADGSHDWEWARIGGVVRDVLPSETDSRWTFLILAAEGTTVYVAAPANKSSNAAGGGRSVYDRFIGAKVLVDGFANPRDKSMRLYQGYTFHCGGLDSIHYAEARPADPFESPEVGTIRHASPGKIATLGRVKASGQVVTLWGRRNMLVATEEGGMIHAVLERDERPLRGSFVDVVGIPHTDLFHITLSHALWRSVASGSLSRRFVQHIKSSHEIADPTAIQPVKASIHGRDVRIIAKVYSLPDREDHMMLAENDSHIFAVDASQVPSALRDVQPGSIVSIVGTCILKTEAWSPEKAFPQIKDFMVIINDEDGVQILRHPPWWTPGRLTAVIGALLAALIGAFFWNRALDRVAERRGKELSREQVKRERSALKAEERTRLAVELHDSLSQTLTGIAMEMEAAKDAGGTAPPEMLAHMDIAAKALKSCRDELRNCLWDLRNQALEETDMTKAILRTLKPHIGASRIDVRFNVKRSTIPDNMAHTLLRVIRELVINAIRHGKATHIKVAGCRDGGTILCSVQDNGSGFDPLSAPGVTQGHFGLQGVRERIAEIKGTIAIDSHPGAGVKVTITI